MFLLALLVPQIAFGHSHNDYAQARPLVGALEAGLCNIEADVFLVDGELLVGHDRKDLKPGRTLRSMYLEPLIHPKQTSRENGETYVRLGPLTLLVDIKEDGEAVYRKLKEQLKPYADSLTSYSGGVVRKGLITVVLSGDRPVKTVLAEKERVAFIDGRLEDLDNGTSASDIPWVSADYTETFKTLGSPLSEPNMKKLGELVVKAHRDGKKLRFWAAPDYPSGWEMLIKAGVDLIGTDHPAKFAQFCLEKGYVKP